MSSASKLKIGFGVLTAIILLSSLAIYSRVSSIESEVSELSGASRSRGLATRGLKSSTLEFYVTVIDQVQTASPNAEFTAGEHANRIERFLEEYKANRINDRQTEMHDRFNAGWVQFKNAGLELLSEDKSTDINQKLLQFQQQRFDLLKQIDDELQVDATAKVSSNISSALSDSQSILIFTSILSIVGTLVALVFGIATSRSVLANEKLIGQQREQLRTTLASIGDAVISTDVRGNVTYLNPIAENLTQWKNDEASGRPLEHVFHIVNESTRAIVESPAHRALREGVVVGLANHTVLIARDHSEKAIDDSAAPIRMTDGEIVGCVLVFRDVSERRAAEQSLTEMRLRRDAMLAAGEVGTWEFDIVKNVVRADINLASMFGVTEAEAAGGPLSAYTDAIHPDDRQRVMAVIGHSLDSENSFEAEYRVIDNNKNIIWVVAKGMIERDQNGQPLRMPGVVVNITKQKQAEERLQAIEVRRQMALNSGGLGTWNIDPLSNLLKSDDQFRKIFSGTTDDITYEQAFARIHQDDRQMVRDLVAAATNPERPIPYAAEYRVVHDDGSVHWVDARGGSNFDLVGSNASLLSFNGTVADITERKEVEAQLQQREQQFTVLAESIPQMAWMANPDGEVFWFNRRWYEYTGKSFGQMQGWGWQDVVVPEVLTAVNDAWKHSLATGQTFDMEIPIRGKDGEYRPFLTLVVPLKDSDQRIARWFGTNTDITEQRRMANELRALAADLSETDRRKNEFLAMLAHELRNPLAPLRNGLSLLKMASADQGSGEVEMMERQIQQMVHLVDDLLDISRISTGKIELRRKSENLQSLIQSAIDACKPTIDVERHKLIVQIPAQPLYVNADAVRINQVFTNLLNNACKYSEPDGQIVVSVIPVQREAVISIKDSGVGIPPEMLEKVFQMFTQVDASLEKSKGGLGIGLSLVKTLVELHGGTVMGKSEGVDKGSEFIVRLPTIPASVDPSLPNASPAPAANSKRRILVVDDNVDAAKTLAMLLKMKGNSTELAHDGEAAVNVAEAFRPEIILLDIGLPKLNGFEVARKIRTQDWAKDVVLVALTGWGQEDDRRKSKEAGFDTHLVKPVDFLELTKLLADSSYKNA